MIQLGLSADAYSALLRTLGRSHLIAARVQLLDFDHNSLGYLEGRVIGGQVNIDSTAVISRQAQIQLVDPDRKAAVDYADGRPRLNRMVRVYYDVWVPGYEWIPIPIFTGPITRTRRSGDGLVEIEASGKQYFSHGPSEQPRTFAKGLNRVNVIRVILNELSGEERFRFPSSWTARTAKKISMGRQSSPWVYANHLARSMEAQIYYDGWGWCRLRKRPTRPSFTFRSGDGGLILDPPQSGESSEELVNRAVVTGAIPAGKKNPLIGRASLPASHPYSKESMKRGGRNKSFIARVEDDSLRTQKEVDEAAKRIVKRVEVASQSVTFTALPMPLLEEEDIISVDTDEVTSTATLRQMSIPLGHEGVSTIGYIASVSRKRR